MSKKAEALLLKIPVLKQLVLLLQKVKLPWLEGLSAYDLLSLYIIGLAEGTLSNRAAAIAFSFFMALFPFALFILNLIPYIPIAGFQDDFLQFVKDGVPPNTYDAVATIINDILNNSHSGLLSSGFILSVFLMTNGINAILGGFETSSHVSLKRGFFSQYFMALGISLMLSLILLITVAAIVVFEVLIQQASILSQWNDQMQLIIISRYSFIILMVLVTTSILFRFGTKHSHKASFITIGSIFTTVLFLISSYFFGIWVVKFCKYNQLYGSIGTLLVLMFYIWINCTVLLLGFELNALINKLKKRNETVFAN